ncbi:MAG: T9SS type A sorting domain-containing protein [Flavobacteriaceae bacterium]
MKNTKAFIHSSGSGEKHIEIYNVLGEKKFETQTHEESIILEDFETGIYVFYLKQDYQKRYKRLVIH